MPGKRIKFYQRPYGDIVGQKVFVYRNLRENCWSLRSLETGRVIAHAHNLNLDNVEFCVSEPGRQRVLREKRKNVHAGIKGVVRQSAQPHLLASLQAVTYNPYKAPTFVTRGPKSGVPVHKADGAVLRGSSVLTWTLPG